MNDQAIENALRNVAQPHPPSDLERRLLNDIPRNLRATSAAPTDLYPWWRRLVPALSFGILLVGCLLAVGVQTKRLLELRTENRQLHAELAAGIRPPENADLDRAASARLQAQAEEEELLRLRSEIAQLRAQINAWNQIAAEHQQLKAAHAAALEKSAPEQDPFADAREKALSTKCVNNLKQIGLAARLWAIDHNDLLPSDFLSIKNELLNPAFFVCPADNSRQPVKEWTQLNANGISYELLSPGADEHERHVVFARCPYHHHLGLTDGSVHQAGANARLIKLDGKTKWETQ